MDLYPTSIEYAKIPVVADVDLDGPIHWAFLPFQKPPDADTQWHGAEWVGSVGKQRVCRLLVAGHAVAAPGVAVKLAAGLHDVWIQIPAVPENIVRKAGSISVAA